MSNPKAPADPVEAPAIDARLVRKLADILKDTGLSEIEVRGTSYYTRFGKLGSPGQTRVTDLGSATAAKSDAEKRAAQKRRDGYRIDR